MKICKFMLDGEEIFCEIDSIADVKDGFWVNEDYEFTKGSDALYWIPPGKINVVKNASVYEIKSVG